MKGTAISPLPPTAALTRLHCFMDDILKPSAKKTGNMINDYIYFKGTLTMRLIDQNYFNNSISFRYLILHPP